MEENLEPGFKFTKKKIISLVVIVFLLAAIPLGVFLVQKTQIFKSRAAENITQNQNKTAPKFKGYIVEFKDKPIVAYQKELSQAGRAESPEVASYEKNTLIPNHEAAKKDILARLGQGGVLGEATSSASATPSATPTKPVPASPPKPVRILGEYTRVFNGIALDVDESKVSEIKKSSYVKNIYPNLEVKANLSQSVPLIGGDRVWQMKDSLGKNITGEGVNIAVLDTGVDYTHPDLGATQITERSMQTIKLPSEYWPSVLYVNNSNAIYYYDHKIYIHNFSSGQLQEVALNNPEPLWARKAAMEDNILVYYAENRDNDAALYFYNFNNGVHQKIVDTQGVGEIAVLNDKIFYGRLKEPRIGSPGPYFYMYDVNSRVETALSDPVFMNSFESIMSRVSNQQIASVFKLSSDYCPQKAVIYNIGTGVSRDIYPLDIGPILDFNGSKILYVTCDKSKPLQDWSVYYLYDINSGTSVKLSYGNQSPGTSGTTTQLLTSNLSKDDVLSPQAIFYAEFFYGSFGSIGDNMVYFTQDYLRSKIIAYDQNQNRYSQINLLKLPYQIASKGNRICFSAEDYALYCHDYNPEDQYLLPGSVFNQKVVDGYDFIEEDNNPLDSYGHGTHVAAIIAGTGKPSGTVNVMGGGPTPTPVPTIPAPKGPLIGVAPGAKIIAYKVLNRYGSGDSSSILTALEKAVQSRLDDNSTNNIDVINMSLGATCYQGYNNNCGPDDPQSKAVDNAVDAGITVVVSAGNSGPNGNTIGSPGTARKAITVGAVDKNKQIASFSSRGPVVVGNETINKPDVVAPGVSICAAEWDSWLYGRRCTDDKHISIDGTSMAAPHVAGAAALIKQAHPDWTPAQIKNALKNTAQSLNLPLDTQGSGLIDVAAAITPKKVCAQVITYAKNPTTNECKTYPTPCDVPTGWITVSSCPAVTKPTPTPKPIQPTQVFSCTPCAVDIAGKRDTKGNNIPDGFVNGWDFSQGIGCRGKKTGDKIWSTCQKVDINGNGTIDTTDWNTWIKCVPKVYSRKCQILGD